MRVKYIKVAEAKKINLNQFPNFGPNGNITGMKEKFYGKDALLVKSGAYVYNVTGKPSIYYNA